MKNIKFQRGLTLIELLVVIVIIGILAAVVMLAINPAEMMRRGRDSSRVQDLETVRKAIDMVLAEGVATLGTGSGNSGTGTQVCGGTGWAAPGLNLCSYLSVLPRDPRHNEDATIWYYQFQSIGTGTEAGTYEIRSRLESGKNWDKVVNDGGNNNTCGTQANPDMTLTTCWYEVGTNPGLDLM